MKHRKIKKKGTIFTRMSFIVIDSYKFCIYFFFKIDPAITRSLRDDRVWLCNNLRGVKLSEKLKEHGFKVEVREYYQQQLFPSEVILARK